MNNPAFVFWIAVGLLAYTWLGYPLLMWTCSLARRAPRRLAIEPGVSVLVIAGNEGARIVDCIQSVLALDYPRERLEIVLAANGGSDATAQFAGRFRKNGLRLVEYTREQSHGALLNDLVPGLKGDVVVVMDARQRPAPQALGALVSNFADPRVGAVSGRVERADGRAGLVGRYEHFLRCRESGVHSTISASSAFYAFRRRLFKVMPGKTLSDHVLQPLAIVRQGYRVLYEPAARARREGPGMETDLGEWVSRLAGQFQLLFRESWLLNPLVNRLWLQTLSHRFLRLVGPLCLGVAFVENLSLSWHPGFRFLFSLQILFYSAAIAGYLMHESDRNKTALFNVPYLFCLVNWATVLGFIRFLFGSPGSTPLKAKS